jgi:hypothetical protein
MRFEREKISIHMIFLFGINGLDLFVKGDDFQPLISVIRLDKFDYKQG